MIRFGIFLLLSPMFFSGCSSTSPQKLMPPEKHWSPPKSPSSTSRLQKADRELEGYFSKASNREERWWVRYQQARLWQDQDPQRSCQHFVDLAKEKNFPLMELASLRAYQSCPVGKTRLPPLDIETLKEKKWLKDLFVDAALASAQASGDRFQEMELRARKSRRALDREEKLKLMDEAIALAKALNLPEKVETYETRRQFLSPREPSSLKTDRRFQRAKDLKNSRRFGQARRIYRRIIRDRSSKDEEIHQALHGLRKAYKLDQKKSAYIAASKQLAQHSYRIYQKNKKNRRLRHKHARWYRDTVLIYVRTLWTDGQVRLARKLLSALPKDLEGLASSAKIYWLQGRIAEEKRRFPLALAWFDHALRECDRRCHMREKISWARAWALVKMNDPIRASSALADLTEENQGSNAKYLFWWGRQLAKMGDHFNAQTKFAQVIQEDPLGYYGILSHREMNIPFSAPGTHRQPASTAPPAPSTALTPQEGQLAQWLIAFNENQLARNLLDEQAFQLRQQGVKDPATWQKVFQLYAHGEAYIPLFQSLGRLAPDLRQNLLTRQPQIIFPQPYRSEVDNASEVHGIAPEVIYSIMRQESAFDRHARSHADAFGLMQLLPSVARRTASKAGIPFRSYRDLYRPEINISLGSAFLRQLWDRYDGQFIIMAASYNASENAIRNWIKHRFDGDPLQFIEDIPYEETRNYIKLVLRNLVFYQRINSPEKEISFPEWCLENIQHVNI